MDSTTRHDMPLPTSGELSLADVAREFGITGPVTFSRLYLGAEDSASIVQPNAGSNIAIPASGAIRIGDFRGASNRTLLQVVDLTLNMDYATLSSDPAAMETFRTDVRVSVADMSGLPLSNVVIMSVTSGSVKVAVEVTLPAKGSINASAVGKLKALLANTDPAIVFGAAFVARHNIIGTVEATASPPVAVEAVKAVGGIGRGAVTVPIADMFLASSNQSFDLSISSNSPFGNVSLAASDLLTVTGNYRETSYSVYVRATNPLGMASAPARVTLTETAAPAPTLKSMLGSATPSNSTPVTYALSNYFSTSEDTSPLYYYLTANPNSNAAILAPGTLAVSGNYRNAAYDVSVTASNAYGKTTSASQTLSVVEPLAPAPTLVSSLGTVSLADSTVTYGMSNYFTASADTRPLYYYLSDNPYSNAMIAGSGVLSLWGASRGTSYSVAVTASNAYGRASAMPQSLAVTEAASVPATPGSVAWVARAGSAGDDTARCLFKTPDGGFLLSGRSGGTGFGAYSPDSNTAFASLAAVNSNEGFVVKYTSGGVALWACACVATPVSVCSVADGSFYVTGTYNNGPLTLRNSDGTTYVGPAAIIKTGGTNSFVAKYSPEGFVQWASGMSTDTNNVQASSICADATGVVVMGLYNGSGVAFRSADGTPFSRTLTAPSGIQCIFIVKYSTSGAVQWVNDTTSTVGLKLQSTQCLCTTTDGGYSAVITVTFNATVYNTNGTMWKALNVGADELVLLKLTVNGAFVWSATMGTTNGDNATGVCSSEGCVYVTGYFFNAAFYAYNADGTAFATTLAPSGNNDACIVKYSLTGTVLWMAKLGSTTDDRSWSVCTTSDGGIAVTGSYRSTLTAEGAIGGTFATALPAPSTSATDAFVAKFTAAGGVAWLASCGVGLGNKVGTALCPDTSGGVIVAGNYNSNPLTVYDAGQAAYSTTLNNSGFNDLFVVRYR